MQQQQAYVYVPTHLLVLLNDFAFSVENAEALTC